MTIPTASCSSELLFAPFFSRRCAMELGTMIEETGFGGTLNCYESADRIGPTFACHVSFACAQYRVADDTGKACVGIL